MAMAEQMPEVFVKTLYWAVEVSVRAEDAFMTVAAAELQSLAMLDAGKVVFML